MVKLRYFIVALCFLSFVSCKEQQRQRYIEPFKKLDVQKFMENKYKWKALDIKNYSFKYNFNDAVFAKYGRGKIV